MKWLMISSVAAVALFAATTTVLRSHSPSTDRPVGSAGMMSLQEQYDAANVNKLPIDGFEDQSLIFPTPAKR